MPTALVVMADDGVELGKHIPIHYILCITYGCAGFL